MAILTFPINPDGLSLAVVVWLDQVACHQKLQRGEVLPPLQHVRALIDSGCDVTAVSAQVLSSLGAASGKPVQTHTAGGIQHTTTFYISLSIPPVAGTSGPMLTIPRLQVTQLTDTLPDYDVLIGLDVIRLYDWNIQGPAGFFSVTF
jgi:hypothetical protein